MGAQDRANQFSRVDEYISGLQQALVDTINRDGDGQIGFDSLGMRQKKRKRINDTQVPLPQGRRAVWHNPANRSNVLLYEEHFQREVPCESVPSFYACLNPVSPRRHHFRGIWVSLEFF